MNWLKTIWLRVRSLAQRREVKREIDEELRFHLEQRTADDIMAGTSPEEAAREARKRFGNLQTVREECRDIRGAGFGEAALQDVRFGLRMMRFNPGFTILSVITLAIGIGATSAIFALVKGVLLTPPAYPEPQRLVLISSSMTRKGASPPHGSMAAEWTAWKSEARSLESLAAYWWNFDFLVLSNGSESVQGMWVTTDYFRTLGIVPHLGRTFHTSESSWQTHPVIILGYDLWQRRFAGDTNIIGKAVRLTRTDPLTVVGVMQPGVRFVPADAGHLPNYDVNAQVDYWMPKLPDPGNLKGSRWNVIARLRDDVTLPQARAELSAISARRAQSDRDFEGLAADVRSLTEELNRDGRRILQPLLGAVVFVFLIACGNVAGLWMARGLQRRREYAIRSALGAQRIRLFRQVVAEGLLLGLVGGVVGAGLTVGIVRLFKALGGFAIPRLDAVTIDWPLGASCLVLAIIGALLAACIPAVRASRLDGASAMKDAGLTTSASGTERRLLGGLVIAQTALTLALVIGAGLLVRTVRNLAEVRPGYETRNILTLSVTAPKDWDNFNVPALSRISALPTVKHAAFVWGLPLTGNDWITRVRMNDSGSPGSSGEIIIRSRAVTPEYFDALGTRIIEGRGFRSSDSREKWKSWLPAPGENPFVAIVNEQLARQFFPGENALGKKLHFSFENVKGDAEIVGIAANARSEALTQEVVPELFLSYWQVPAFSKHLVVRTAADPRSLIATIERELRAVDPAVAIEQIKTMEQIRSDSVASQTFAMRLLIGFSAVAGVLALVGIYGVFSLSVGSRRREIAIRLAVGAQRWSIIRLVLVDGLKLILVGLVLGLGLAIILGRVLVALLFGVTPSDPAVLVSVTIALTVAALLACFIPIRRATRIDPMTTLRYE